MAAASTEDRELRHGAPLSASNASDLEAQVANENSPLLPEAERDLPRLDHRGTTFTGPRQAKTEEGKHAMTFRRGSDVQDAMTYHAQDLSSWGSLFSIQYSVWNRRSLWIITMKLLALATFVALMVLICVRDAEAFAKEAKKFGQISRFLSTFVGLLLGFFMSTSVQRWWACAENFHKLCAAVRGLHIGLNSCGVPEEELKHILRYGVISAWILHMQLHVEAQSDHEQEDTLRRGWEHIRTGEGHDEEFGQVTSEEMAVLRGVSDPPGALWMWIGSLLGSFAEDGLIPPLASPTYGRLMNIGLEGFNSIRAVRCAISVQAPFIYVQMLSSLVHINNIVNAIGFGLTWGASLGTMLAHWGVPYWGHVGKEITNEQAQKDTQSLLVSFFFSCFGPFVYQALLEVSIAIAQPFSNKDAVVPTARIIHLLERDLHDGLKMAKQIPWKQPVFKKTPPAIKG